jgi:acyl-CoA synthetase (AMP-forming)/AMP-acid ligase II/3-hydroxymyristoyl/3-hydroxydecanoyl-(acyl carrier protein) dehydratase
MLDIFNRLSNAAPDALAGWRDGVPVTCAQLDRRARAWCALAHRTASRDIALFHDDSLEFAAALAGAWQAGKTIWLAADVLPASCASLKGSAAAFFGQFPADCSPASPQEGERWDGAWTAPAPGFPALVVYTSGSTGAPKAIPKRMSQLTGEVQALEAQFGGAVGQSAVVATVSHQHIYGLLFKVLWPLAAGRPVHARSIDYPEALARALAAQPCVLVASPAHLKRLPDHVDWQDAASQLQAVFSSGGLLDAEAARHARTLMNRRPVEVYGSSESGGIAWRTQGDGADDWQPLPGVEWRVGGDGQLEVRSAHAGDGWLPMADRVAPSEGGRFVLQGRSDRIVKIEEKRVSLDAIEATLLGSGLVRESRVVPIPAAPGQRQLLAAFVVPTAEGQAVLDQHGKAALNERLRQVLARAIERVALPRRWRYLESLPVNTQGKTTSADLLALLEEPARPRFPSVQVLEAEAGRALLELVVPAGLLYFDGHFPVAPVLPGVVQVEWAIHYARQYFALAPRFKGINALKFQQMVRPGEPVRLELVHDQAKGSLNFRYFSNAGQHASGRIIFSND